jgi:hypothetical protein
MRAYSHRLPRAHRAVSLAPETFQLASEYLATAPSKKSTIAMGSAQLDTNPVR